MDTAPSKPSGADNQRKVGTVTFSPGLRIDWSRHRIELDAVVVLRRGPLELLACSPHTREHESIVAVTARPRDIYQAMGMIGLAPGHPVRYDEKLGRLLPPVGESLRISVRYGHADDQHDVPVEEWLQINDTGRSPTALPWVFAGSRTFESGRFGADADGTVICVVDFDTALISLGTLHSADNNLLWLSAKTAAIPAKGTKCVITIQKRKDSPPAQHDDLSVKLDNEGNMHVDGTVVSAAELASKLRNARKKTPSQTIILNAAPGCGKSTIEAATKALITAGVHATSIRVHVAAPPKGDANAAG